MEVTTFDFGDVCLGTIEDDEKTVNAQGVVALAPRSILQLAQEASGHLDKLRELEPGYVTVISADGLELTDRDYRSLAALDGLRTVDFDNTAITNEQAAWFCRDGLKALHLGAESIDDGVMDAVASVQSLLLLHLSNSSVGDTGFAAMANHPAVEEVHLCESGVSSASASVLATLPSLVTLHMDGANDDVLVAIARPNTGWVHLRSGDFGERGIGALQDCVGLETLGLFRCRLTDEGQRALGRLARVSDLWLGRSELRDEALAEALNEMTELSFVAVNNSAVGDATARALGQLPKLTTVHLSDTAVTDEGLKGLGASRSVSFLSLSNTDVTDEGIAHLAEVASLETVQTDGTAVTDTGRALLTQLPKPFDLG